jgi:dipeptide/tripeptide permease
MDKRAVEKIDEIVAIFLVSCKFRCVEDQYVCSLQVFTDQMQNMKECYGGISGS